MKKIINFCTYGDNKYATSKIRIKKEAIDFGVFNNIHICGPEDLSTDFKERFIDILKEKRGGGYWIWKPYIINKIFETMSDGEYLVYLDAGCSINKNGINRFYQYLDMLDNSEYGCFGFQMCNPEKIWTKIEIFDYFNIKINSNIANTGQLVGGLQIFKKNEHSNKIIKLWLDTLYKNPQLFTDYKYKTQIKNFRDNRHDQSICSIIRKIYGSVIIKEETWYRNWNRGKNIPFLAKRIRG